MVSEDPYEKGLRKILNYGHTLGHAFEIQNKYSILRKAVSKEIADFAYSYFLNKRKVAKFLFDNRYI